MEFCFSSVLNHLVLNIVQLLVYDSITVKPVFKALEGTPEHSLESLPLHDRCPFTLGSLTREDGTLLLR